MRNYVQSGDLITITAAAAIASGDGVLTGALFGVAAADYAAGAQAEIKTTGVFDLAADPAATASIGDKAYWSVTDKRVTATAASNKLIGVFVTAKVASFPLACVRLNGTSV